MSGVEVVGLLLGAFPLLISAMEHYEETTIKVKKMWKIKRTYRLDLDRIRDCQLNFRLTLKRLLLPLVQEDVINISECEELLANPGGPGWKYPDVEAALITRLQECHERYLEILQNMVQTMEALWEVTKVQDSRFQSHLAREKEKKSTPAISQAARDRFKFQANEYLMFQAKRVSYALSGMERDALVAELERQNKILDDLLTKCENLSKVYTDNTRPSLPKISTKALGFWRHADSIYKAIRDAWHCSCRSYASLRLQHPLVSLPQMNVVLHLCNGGHSIAVKLDDSPPTLQLSVPTKLPTETKRKNKPQSPFAPIASHADWERGQYAKQSTYSGSSSTYTLQTQASPAPSLSPALSPSANDLKLEGLCKAISENTSVDDIGKLVGLDNEYTVLRTQDQFAAPNGTSLAKTMLAGSTQTLTRVQRYGLALNLASSHMQLHSTPWLTQRWTSDEVLLPSLQGSKDSLLVDKPYILAQFKAADPNSPSPKDQSFATLGIVLLELCFGRRLEDHSLWQNPGYAALKADPMMRQTVAYKWLEDVQGEAGEDYADAVNWTLHQAPTTIKDDAWRKEFAHKVVQPLQRCYDSMSSIRRAS